MIKHVMLAAALVAACLLSPSKGWAQPAGAGGDYYGGGPLTPPASPLAPYPQPGTSSLYTPLPYPPQQPALPLGYASQQRIEALRQQNLLLSEEWAQQVLRDALRR